MLTLVRVHHLIAVKQNEYEEINNLYESVC